MSAKLLPRDTTADVCLGYSRDIRLIRGLRMTSSNNQKFSRTFRLSLRLFHDACEYYDTQGLLAVIRVLGHQGYWNRIEK